MVSSSNEPSSELRAHVIVAITVSELDCFGILRYRIWNNKHLVTQLCESPVMRVLLIGVVIALTAMAASDAEMAAAKSADAWLAVVDAGKYAESWDAASATFQKGVTKDAWVKAVSTVRGQVGKIESRKFSVAQALKDPPNAPPGDYIILQYISNFSNKNGATETVVMSLDSDKRWRTSGYFVK